MFVGFKSLKSLSLKAVDVGYEGIELLCEHCFKNSKTLDHCSYQNTDYRFTL